MSSEVFISFASKDVKVAMTLCNALENRGFSCWISARDIEPGANFQVAIVQALRRAKVMLLVFTAASNTSEEMTKELALASQQKIMVIPLRVEDVAPNDAFAYEFATRQWIDAFADWESSLDQLARRISHAKAADTAATREPALEVQPEPQAASAAPEPVEPVAPPAEIVAAPAPPKSVEPPKAVEAQQQNDEEFLAEPLAANSNKRRLLPLAAAVAAAAVAIIGGATVAMKTRAPPPESKAAVVITSMPTAPVITPAPEIAPEPVAAPAVEEPELVKASRPKQKRGQTAADTDIPF